MDVADRTASNPRSGTGTGAVVRLEREQTILRHLDGLDFVPAVRDYRTVGEHHVLVRECIDGTPLDEEFNRRFPLNGRYASDTSLREYAHWALAIIDDVERNVEALWQRGVIFGDLRTSNIIVRPDGRTAMINFEAASLIGEDRQPALSHPAFAAPPDRCGFEVDRYSLACLQLAMFLPLTALFGLDPGKAVELASEIYKIFPVPAGYFDDAVATITGVLDRPTSRTGMLKAGTLPQRDLRQLTGTSSWRSARQSMISAILTSATPERDDRLFPGDVEQFSAGGLNIAHGAAGVLYALSVAGGDRYPTYEQWLIDRALRPDPSQRLGFYDGLHGVAYVLDHLGYRDEALSVVYQCRRAAWRQLGLDLAGGLAGIGLNLHHFAAVTGDTSLQDAATEVAALVAARLGQVDSVATTSGGDQPYAGLMHGSAGPALMFIRFFETGGDTGYLDLAAVALDQDLRRCVTQADGCLRVNEGKRTVPYLSAGSIGIGLVLQEFLVHRPDDRYADVLARIALAAQSIYYAQSGLFHGRAGALLFHSGSRPLSLSLPRSRSGQQTTDADGVPAIVAVQIRRLAWHAMSYQGYLAFPGEQLCRLSMDLGTGTAGVLLALAAAAVQPDATLPFLSSR